MMIQLDTLFEVGLFHNYYKSGISDDFDIEPTALCKNQLLNYGLIFRKTSKGFVVLYELVKDDHGNPHPLKSIEENVKYSFMLKSNNPYLINYSDLPLDSQANQIYNLHNLNNNMQNGDLLLTSDSNAEFLSQKDRIHLKSQLFNYSSKSANTSVQIETLDGLNNTLLRKNVLIVEGIFNYSIDLRRYPPGRFTLNVDGSKKLEFYANDELIGKNVFGVIDIFQNNSVPAPYRFTKPNHDVFKKTYHVKIDNRKTYWKYNMVLKYRLGDVDPNDWPDDWPNDFSVVFPDSEGLQPQFNRQNIGYLADGAAIVPFVSVAKLPLQQVPIKGIQLKKTSSNNNGNISGIRDIDHLPNPSVQTINTINNEIYSSIFVYL